MRKMKVMFSQISKQILKDRITMSIQMILVWSLLKDLWFVFNSLKSTGSISMTILIWRITWFIWSTIFYRQITLYFALNKVDKVHFVFVPAHSEFNIFSEVKNLINVLKRWLRNVNFVCQNDFSWFLRHQRFFNNCDWIWL